MSALQRGQKLDLPSSAKSLELVVAGLPTAFVVDPVLIGLDSYGHLSDGRYFVFFNCTASPEQALKQLTSERFALDLARLPASISRLQLSLAMLQGGEARQLGAVSIHLGCAGSVLFEYQLLGTEFANERCLIALELYRKGEGWRVAAIGQGFAGGLDALLRSLGAEVSSPSASAKPLAPVNAAASVTPRGSPVSAPNAISLEKRIAAQAPALVKLAKSASVSLAKHKLLEVQARVGLVCDCSGSMCSNYDSGRIQAVINRLIPLALAFDDDGSIEHWAFADKAARQPDITVDTYADLAGYWLSWAEGGGNNEPAVIKAIIKQEQRSASALPLYLLFITDGGIYENEAIETLLRQAASLPIFWQFVGLGGSNYGALERLDELDGRVVDNAGFFAIDDLSRITDEELYDRLLKEFPSWLKAARSHAIVK